MFKEIPPYGVNVVSAFAYDKYKLIINTHHPRITVHIDRHDHTNTPI